MCANRPTNLCCTGMARQASHAQTVFLRHLSHGCRLVSNGRRSTWQTNGGSAMHSYRKCRTKKKTTTTNEKQKSKQVISVHALGARLQHTTYKEGVLLLHLWCADNGLGSEDPRLQEGLDGARVDLPEVPGARSVGGRGQHLHQSAKHAKTHQPCNMRGLETYSNIAVGSK